MADEIIPQSIDTYLEQLTSEEPRLRYEAICFFARSVFVERFWEVYNAVWRLTEDEHETVKSCAGIAASMITARHMPLMNKGYIGMTNGYITDYLTEWSSQ